jgi:MoxR-like ATPase
MSTTDEWKLFKGPDAAAAVTDESPTESPRPVVFPAPPPWRDFTRSYHRATTYRPGPHEIEMVNAALYLRRPLLITGKPGTGKSSLIYSVARELGLGKVLVWPITSRATVRDGLYQYDAIGRLRDSNIQNNASPRQPDAPDTPREPDNLALARYLSLGPLGTALLPSTRPRALLIDEIDKADIDFPNDLLHALEEGNYEIPEARRIAQHCPDVDVPLASDEPGSTRTATIHHGRVQCTMFPFVVITSNGERDLPPAFLRRCLRLKIDPPNETQLQKIVAAHFPELADGATTPEIQDLINRVAGVNRNRDKIIATDQLLAAIHIIRGEQAPTGDERTRIVDELLRELGQGQ